MAPERFTAFEVMTLQPLNEEQQRAIIQTQLKGNTFFEHLLAFSSIRNQHDSIYARLFKPAVWGAIESLESPDRLRRGDGSFDPEMRQRNTSGAIVQRNSFELKSTFLHGLNAQLDPLLALLETSLSFAFTRKETLLS